MYQIIKNKKIIALSEEIRYIRRHPDGFYIKCDEYEAEGVAVEGVPYALKEGSLGDIEAVTVIEVNTGDLITQLETVSHGAIVNGTQAAIAAKMVVQDKTDIKDGEALLIPDMFRTWEEVLVDSRTLAANVVIKYGDVLYRVLQPVTPMAHQRPGGEGMLAIYRPIVPDHDGSEVDPIPWIYGMNCKAKLYYSYNEKVYRCAGDMMPCIWPPDSDIWQWTTHAE